MNNWEVVKKETLKVGKNQRIRLEKKSNGSYEKIVEELSTGGIIEPDDLVISLRKGVGHPDYYYGVIQHEGNDVAIFKVSGLALRRKGYSIETPDSSLASFRLVKKN